MKITSLILSIFFFSNTFSQTVVKMKRVGGVSVIPCKVNGLNLSFVFDTGASDVSISMTEAAFMLKNDYLDKEDFLDSQNYLDANGNITEGIGLRLREIEISGLKLYNIKASIVKNIKAPLLLGQTAISRLGIIQLDFQTNTLTILKGNDSLPKSIPSFEIDSTIKIDNIEVAVHDFPEKLNWEDAIGSCFSLGKGWRLPTIEELTSLYKNKKAIPNFNGNYYWSNTDNRSSENSKYLNIINGFISNSPKVQALYVRAVRSL